MMPNKPFKQSKIHVTSDLFSANPNFPMQSGDQQISQAENSLDVCHIYWDNTFKSAYEILNRKHSSNAQLQCTAPIHSLEHHS